MNHEDNRRDSKWDTREINQESSLKKKKPASATYMGPPAYLLDSNAANQSTNMIDLAQDNKAAITTIEPARSRTKMMQTPHYFSSHGSLPGPLKPEKMMSKRKQWDQELREGIRSKYQEQLNSYADVREEQRPKKRRREATPEDDYPIPMIDDMSIHPNDQMYVRAVSGRPTMTNPSKNWTKRVKAIQSEEEESIQEELRELEELRQARQKRDEDEQYAGLKKFKGKQRGWNGLRESQRQQDIKDRRQQDREAEAKAKKARTISPTFSQTASEPGSVTAEQLKSGYEAFRTREVLSQIALDDAVKDDQVGIRNYSNSIKWDYDAVVATARARKAETNKVEGSSGRRESTASFIPLSPTVLSPIEEDEADAVFEEEEPSPKKRRLSSPS